MRIFKLLLSDTVGLKELRNAESLKIEGGSNNLKGGNIEISCTDVICVIRRNNRRREYKKVSAPSNNY